MATALSIDNVLPTTHHPDVHSKNTSSKPPAQLDLGRLRQQVDQEAQSAAELKIPQSSEEELALHPAIINRELKAIAYRRVLTRARKHSSSGQKISSILVHQTVMEALGDKLASTLGRPSGLLGSGLLTFFGTLAYYLTAKYYGYDYNNLIFVWLLLIGFPFGWLTEIILYNLRKPGQN